MTIKYLDSKRISALSGDFIGTSGWTTSNSSSIGISGNEITIQERNGDYDEVAYKSFTALGADASFTFRFPIKITTITQTGGTDSIRVVMGVSSASDIADSTARDEVGIIWRVTDTINKFYAFTADGTALTSHYSGTDFATTPSTTGGDGNGNYYVEISGSGGTYTFKLFSDSTYDTLIESESITDAGITGLQYYVFRTWELTTHSNQARATVTISDKPNSVQDNSILVEKDTGERFWSSGYGTGGAITKDSSVNTQTATSGSTLTASLTVASNFNRIIIISLTSYIDPALVPTGITFGSQAFTKLDSYGDTNGNGSVWYLVNPNVGTDTVTATWASSIGKRGFTAYSFYNVAQTNPLSGFTTATGTGNTATGSITPTTAGSAIFSSLSWILGYSVNARPVSTLDYEYYIYTGGKTGGSSYNLTPTISSSNAMNYTNIDDNGSTSTSAQYRIGMMEIKKGNATWTNPKANVGQIAQLSGSSSSNAYTASSEFYSIPTDTWASAFNIASGGRARAGSAGTPTHCYLLGGQDGSSYYNAVDRVAWADQTQNATTMAGTRAWSNTVSNAVSVCVGQGYYNGGYSNAIEEFTYPLMTYTSQGNVSATHLWGGSFGNSSHGFTINGNNTGIERYTYSDKSKTSSGFTASPTTTNSGGHTGNSTTGISINNTAGSGNARYDAYNISADTWTTASATSSTPYENGRASGSTKYNLYSTQTNTSVARSCEKYDYGTGTLSSFTSVATNLDGADQDSGASSNNTGVTS